MKKIMSLGVIGMVVVGLSVSASAFERESEHPPLSENTKRAIADYKRQPTEENKSTLLKVMNESYDGVIQLKKDKLAERIRDRDKNINRWLQAVRSGGVPPFMTLNTENNKGDERKVVAEAVEAYKKDSSAKNEAAVKSALTAYYDVFIDEQRKHIKETEDARESRMTASLARFTSDRFRPGPRGARATVAQDDVLSEIICAYISVGAEIVPVNPEARVRERGFNAAINTAQTRYEKEPTKENKAALRAEIAKAFRAACDVRLEEIAKAEKKGLAGAGGLLAQMQDAEFRDSQFRELTQQRNLYGRIDRMVTFGRNTTGDWESRMKVESRELAKLLQESGKTAKQALESNFNDVYAKMLSVQKKHLQEVKAKLDSFTDATLEELVD